MRTQLKSMFALLVLLPLPVLSACGPSPTDPWEKNKVTDLGVREVTRLLVSPEILNLNPGESTQLEVFLERKGPDLGPPDLEVIWTSSDPGVASVSESGEVTALWEGDVTISARHGMWRAGAKVSVTVDTDLPRDFGK